MTESEEALVTRSRQGDRGAFEELVRRTARLVVSRAYLETGDVHEAEDIAQETYLIAWRRIAQLKEANGLRPWLTQIAHNAAIDAARRETRKKRQPLLAGLANQNVQQKETVPSAQESAEKKEERDRALIALRQLPEEYRQPLMLRYLAGADYETISRELALTNGSLRGLLHRGLELLRQRMKGATEDTKNTEKNSP